ncbi:radical SAM protein [bacterium SCSIO 12827]|nr:radical SAM protein [bacterium SCSIO 12827]
MKLVGKRGSRPHLMPKPASQKDQDQIVRSNPFKPLYESCNAGNSRKKFEELPDFPNFVDLELTNTCNFRCLMCPTGNHSLERGAGFMAEDTFRKVVDELALHNTPIRFILWGEPTLHPKFLEFLSMANERGILTHINTNGSKLTPDFIKKMIDRGIDSIKFSFQGVDRKSYHEMRNIDYFDGLIEVMKVFRDMRGDRDLPYLHASTSITYETREQVQAFRDLMKELVDAVSIGRTVFYHADLKSVRLRPSEMKILETLIEEESVVKKHPECPEVYDKLSINWDGSVTACCDDPNNEMVLGSLDNMSISEIWHSEKLNYYREMLAQMRHDELPRCKTCYDYQGLVTPGLQEID